MSVPLLSVQGLAAGYSNRRVVEAIDLTVGIGACVALIGGNGSGKSTVLKAICGLIQTFAGTISLCGRSLDGMAAENRIKSGLGYVPQTMNIFCEMSVRENLLVGGHGLSARGARESVEKVLDEFPRVREMALRRAGTLSGGERQMVAIARSLVSQPRALLLDEPTAGLSISASTELFTLLEQLCKSGLGILLVEHKVKQALKSSHYVYGLKAGRIAEHAAAEDFLNNGYRLQELMLGSAG